MQILIPDARIGRMVATLARDGYLYWTEIRTGRVMPNGYVRGYDNLIEAIKDTLRIYPTIVAECSGCGKGLIFEHDRRSYWQGKLIGIGAYCDDCERDGRHFEA